MVHQLLSGTAMAFQPLALGTMSLACHVQSKLYHDRLKDTPTNISQKLMMAPILVMQPVDVKQAMKALKADPQVVKLVTQPPPKPSFQSSLFLFRLT